MTKSGKERLIEAVYRYWREGIMVLGLGLVAAGLSTILKGSSSSEIEIIPAQEAGQVSNQLVVDIQGAVMKPGVYKLNLDSRVNDLLIACGGLSQEADREWVAKNLNRAAVLVDGAKIYIPQLDEKVGQVAGSQSRSLPAQAGLININQAGQSQLETLSGIGPSFARKIIEYREAHGGFKSTEELMAVPGIGKKTFDRLKDEITIY